MTITIVYDNYGYDPRAKVGSGFACVVKTNTKCLLFDTGAHGPTLLYNLEALGFRLEEIDAVVISHIDSDHVGGLFKFLEKRQHVMVYLPESFPPAFKDLVVLHGAHVAEVSSAAELYPGIYTTGEMGEWLKEQSLIIQTNQGWALIMGDAHPGVIDVVKKAKTIVQDELYLVMGGFHLDGASVSELQSVTRSFCDMGVKRVALSHSSGDRARSLFQQEYREQYIECGVGKTIECH
ncbi:MAG: MBL fold metallo-hydrolase [Chloroflexota bacterium]|nr:MBL fold metallo-hydrolase [Chloroflexota bacterium]